MIETSSIKGFGISKGVSTSDHTENLCLQLSFFGRMFDENFRIFLRNFLLKESGLLHLPSCLVIFPGMLSICSKLMLKYNYSNHQRGKQMPITGEKELKIKFFCSKHKFRNDFLLIIFINLTTKMNTVILQKTK